MKTQEVDKILRDNPTAGLKDLSGMVARSTESIRKRRVKLGLPPLRVTSQNQVRVSQFEKKLQTLIIEVLSCRDVTETTQEAFYHGLMLAFVSGLKETHEIKSNKESGKGFYDVAIIPKDSTKLGIVMEFKAIQEEEKLDDEASKALAQINKSNYIAELKQRGIHNTIKIGIAFSGKTVRIISQL